jgi:hypothetical protein
MKLIFSLSVELKTLRFEVHRAEIRVFLNVTPLIFFVVYFTTLSGSNGNITDGWWVWKDLEGSARCLIDVLSRICLEGLRTSTTSTSITGFPAKIRTEHLTNISLMHYRRIIWYIGTKISEESAASNFRAEEEATVSFKTMVLTYQSTRCRILEVLSF